MWLRGSFLVLIAVFANLPLLMMPYMPYIFFCTFVFSAFDLICSQSDTATKVQMYNIKMSAKIGAYIKSIVFACVNIF